MKVSSHIFVNDLHSAPEYAEVDGIKNINDGGINGNGDDLNGTSAYATTNLMGGDYNGSSSLDGNSRTRSVSAAVSDFYQTVQGSAKRRGLGCVNSLPGFAWL